MERKTEGQAAERIDVLAVMQASADQLWRYRRDVLAREEEAARAAVAELVAAVQDVYVESDREPCSVPCPSCRISAALAPFQTGGAK